LAKFEEKQGKSERELGGFIECVKIGV